MATDNKDILTRLALSRAKKERKQPTPIAKESAKTKERKKEEKALLAGDDTLMEKFFKKCRTQMTGTCQCGCGMPSSKKDDLYFRHSIAHLFPKTIFASIMHHPLNWVERNFWNGCHSNMDNRSIDLWPMMADFDDIKAKFHELAPLLTDEERAHKFYHNLEQLVFKS